MRPKTRGGNLLASLDYTVVMERGSLMTEVIIFMVLIFLIIIKLKDGK